MPTRIRRTDGQTVSVEPLSPASFAPYGTVIQNPSKTSFPSPMPAVVTNQGSATKYPEVSPLISSYNLAKSRQAGVPKLSLFSSRPRSLKRVAGGRQAFDVNILERHPFTPQTFIPTGLAAADHETAYLVIVAPTLPSTSAELDVQQGPTIWQRLLLRPDLTLSDQRHELTGLSDPIAISTATPRSSGPPDLSHIKAFIARGDQAVTYGTGTWHAPMVVLGKQAIDFVVVQYANGVAVEDCQEVELYDGSLDVVVEDDLVSRRGVLAKL